MLTYNTHLKQLVLPEYGRTIQSMVDHCMTIDDRDARNACARSIVAAMARIVPTAGNTEEARRKLWDHLAIMSDFALDIDWPFEPVRPDELDTKPDALPYTSSEFSFRHYGKLLEHLIEHAATYPEGPERDALILLVANHAKKLMLGVNPDGVDDEKVFKDLYHLSHGAIRLDPATTHLHEYNRAPEPTTGKKKRKRKK